MTVRKHTFVLASAFVFISLFFVFDSSIASAATYYTCNNASTCGSGWVTGNDANSCNSKSTACGTIRAGILKMLGGDELVIGDGTYTGTSNRIYSMPSGNASAYTKIRAENDWGVVMTDSGGYPVHVRNISYVEVRGIHFRNYSSVKVFLENADHIKIIKNSSDDNGGNAAGFLASNSNYVLFEENYKYGNSRYAFQVNAGAGASHHIIFRRNVCRWDYSNVEAPLACFANYDQQYVYYQNNIAIDAKDYTGVNTSTYVYEGMKGFFTPNGALQTYYDGNIALNLEGAGWWIEDSPVESVFLNNNVAWDMKDSGQSSYEGYPAHLFRSRGGNGPLTINHNTFGVSDLGLGIRMQASNDSLINSIIYGVGLNAGNYAVYESVDNENYNAFYNNTGNRNKSTALGSNSITNTNPLINSLKYLPRIETGSDLSGRASDGGNIGATIMKKIGVSGTLYGDSGWDTTTSDNLWPFPNEDVIKTEMKSFSKTSGAAYAGSPAMSGNRGFAADGNGLYGGPITLTSYIWEYLGNPCPADICNYGTQTFHLADLNQNNRIEMSELIAFIGRWKSGQAGLNDVLTALDKWLRGL